MEETDANGVAVTRYTQGLGIDEPLALHRGGATYYYQADGLGSVVSLSTANGSTQVAYTYDSFGRTTAQSSGFVNVFQYTARQRDPETDLYYYRARYYDRVIGRFISEDPIRMSAGINFYTYVEEDPVNFRDPSGKFRVHGNWCGPDWTGGLKEPYNPAHAAQYKKPIDGVDEACMHHDICYFNCRSNYPCDKSERQGCMRRCDMLLVAEVPGRSVRGRGILTVMSWHLFPDAGTNEECGCHSERIPLSVQRQMSTYVGDGVYVTNPPF